MTLNIGQRNAGALFVVLCAVGTLSACTPSDKPAPTIARRCPTPQDSIIGGAVAVYAGTAQPLAHRFLIPIRTDSALPEPAYWGLQGKTTLHVFPPDTAGQRKARVQLAVQMAYVNLLIAYHGQRTLPDGRIAMDFSGTYVGGKDDGKTSPRKTVTFTCLTTGAGGERFVVGDSSPPA